MPWERSPTRTGLWCFARLERSASCAARAPARRPTWMGKSLRTPNRTCAGALASWKGHGPQRPDAVEVASGRRGGAAGCRRRHPTVQHARSTDADDAEPFARGLLGLLHKAARALQLGAQPKRAQRCVQCLKRTRVNREVGAVGDGSITRRICRQLSPGAAGRVTGEAEGVARAPPSRPAAPRSAPARKATPTAADAGRHPTPHPWASRRRVLG